MNYELLRLYGNEWTLEKRAAGPLATLGAGALFMGMLRSDAVHREKVMAEAEAINRTARYLEAKKMSATIAGLGGPGSAAAGAASTLEVASGQPAGELKVGSAAALVSGTARDLAKLAHTDLSEMEKKAIMGTIGKTIGAIGKATSSVGRGMQHGFTAQGRFARAASGGGKTLDEVAGATMGQRMGGRLQRMGERAQAAGQKIYGGAAAKSMGRGMSSVSKAPAQAAAAAAPAATAAAAPAAQAAKQTASKPLVGWRSKALLGGATLGAGYVGYKGLQAARDYMMVPTSSTQNWGVGAPVLSNVNQYGYATY